MAEFADKSVEIQLGCGLMAAFFQRANSKPIKQPLPPLSTKSSVKKSAKPSQQLSQKPFKKPPSISSRNSNSHDQKHVRTSSDGTRSSSKQSSKFSSTKKLSQVDNLAYTQKLRKEPTFTSCDSSATVISHRRSTGNVMLLGHLGNLKQQQGIQNGSSDQKTILQKSRVLMGNIVRQPSLRNQMLNKLDPDVLKSMGNEHYRDGRFEEAIPLYNQAISINPRNACYYSNKSAALMSLGHLIEAVFACREAIRLDPSYHNAHYRLARLYLRLGAAEKAIDHYKQSGRKVDKKDIAEAHGLCRQLSSCTEALKHKDYNTLLKETQNALSLGAHSAPQIFAMRADALMKLHRHEEAYTTIQNGPDFQTEQCTRLFGSTKTAYLLIIRAEAYAAVGRFEDAMAAAQEAAILDPSNETNTTLRRIKALASARLKGNEFFKENRFSEASSVYTEGLEQEPYNSVLLFNRAACRFKLGQFEKAVEDCTAALILRPSYTKARLRRADCYIKLERWKAAIQDCEVLIQENSDNEEVNRVFSEAKFQLQKQLNEDLI